MLVRFTSQATANLLMFDDVARALLKVVGKSPTQRGVITVAEMAPALAHLQAMSDQEQHLKAGRSVGSRPALYQDAGAGAAREEGNCLGSPQRFSRPKVIPPCAGGVIRRVNITRGLVPASAVLR